MTKLIILFTMIITGIICNAQVSENREITNFSQIEVANGIELFYLQNNEAQSIRLESISEEALKSIKIELNSGILKIYNTNQKFSNNPITKVFLTGNVLRAITGKSKSRIVLQGTINASDMVITILDGAYFNGKIISTASVQINTDYASEFNGRIETKNLVGNFKNNSRINLSGTAHKATFTSTTKSYCNAKNFLVENMEVHSSDATVMIRSKDKLVVDLNENAKLTYFGQPKDVKILNATDMKIETANRAKILLASK